MHAPNDELEEALNEALRRYADPLDCPQPAVLAACVFAASKEISKGTTAPGWRWLFRGPALALACLLIFVIASISYEKHRASRIPLAPLNAPARPLHGVSNREQAPRVQAHFRAIRSKAYRPPKLNQFPQPQPLSEQEKLMLTFVSTATPAHQRVVAQAGEEPEFMRLAELQSPATHLSTLKTEIPGEPHEEHR